MTTEDDRDEELARIVEAMPSPKVTGPPEPPEDVEFADAVPRDGYGLTDVVRDQLAGLPGERPLPSVAQYDQLLTRDSPHAGHGLPETGSPTG